ncbi:hypothetical protein AAY473_006938, partial [Plecturocebus cupreus]
MANMRGETPPLLKIQKTAGHGGTPLESQLGVVARFSSVTQQFNAIKLIQKISQAWQCAPVVPATREAEAGELLEPGRRRVQRAEFTPLHSSLTSTMDSSNACNAAQVKGRDDDTAPEAPAIKLKVLARMGLKLLTSSNPLHSASQSAGITSVSHHARPSATISD